MFYKQLLILSIIFLWYLLYLNEGVMLFSLFFMVRRTCLKDSI